jgi:hypothetical protein
MFCLDKVGFLHVCSMPIDQSAGIGTIHWKRDRIHQLRVETGPDTLIPFVTRYEYGIYVIHKKSSVQELFLDGAQGRSLPAIHGLRDTGASCTMESNPDWRFAANW